MIKAMKYLNSRNELKTKIRIILQKIYQKFFKEFFFPTIVYKGYSSHDFLFSISKYNSLQIIELYSISSMKFIQILAKIDWESEIGSISRSALKLQDQITPHVNKLIKKQKGEGYMKMKSKCRNKGETC